MNTTNNGWEPENLADYIYSIEMPTRELEFCWAIVMAYEADHYVCPFTMDEVKVHGQALATSLADMPKEYVRTVFWKAYEARGTEDDTPGLAREPYDGGESMPWRGAYEWLDRYRITTWDLSVHWLRMCGTFQNGKA